MIPCRRTIILENQLPAVFDRFADVSQEVISD